MKTKQDAKQLSGETKNAIAKVVYEHGKPQHLKDEDLLSISGCLFPHYPPTDEERNAARVLREWRAASEVIELTRKPLEQLAEAVQLPAQAYRDAVHHWEHMAYERRERWGHPEMRARDLFKDLGELGRRLAQGDPEAVLALLGMMRGEWPFVGAPPAVTIPKELVDRVLEEATRARDELSPLFNNVAHARQCLSDYAWRIVASEGIEPVKD